MVVDDKISFREVVAYIKTWRGYLRRHYLFILIAVTLTAGLGIAYSLLKKPDFIAKTMFVLEDGESSGGMSQYAGLASMVGIDMAGGGGGIFQGDNIFELYRSRTMIKKTLLTPVHVNGQKQLLIDMYINDRNLRAQWKDNPKLKNLSFAVKDMETPSRIQDSIITSIASTINKLNLSVSKPDKKLSIINVTVTAKNEMFAKLFNDQIVQNVNDFYVQTKTKKSLENLAILQRQTDSVRKVMNGAIFSSASVLDATPNLNPTRLVLRAPSQRSQYNADASKAILSELIKNLELSKISLRKETPLIQVIDAPVLPLERKTVGLIFAGLAGFFVGLFLSIVALSARFIYSQLLADDAK